MQSDRTIMFAIPALLAGVGLTTALFIWPNYRAARDCVPALSVRQPSSTPRSSIACATLATSIERPEQFPPCDSP
jgi:hypothetical protein